MQYADLAIAALAVLGLAWLADGLTGRRGLGAAVMVAATGAGCGGFLAVRVFAVASMDQWPWIVWATAGAALSLLIYILFRSKR